MAKLLLTSSMYRLVPTALVSSGGASFGLLIPTHERMLVGASGPLDAGDAGACCASLRRVTRAFWRS